MECRIENKGELKLLVYFKDFNKETGKEGIPALWDAHHKQELRKEVSCYFGVCTENGKETFKYGIGLYVEDAATVPEGFQKLCLPEQTWAVFRFEASTSEQVQDAWDCVKKEFLSSSEEYEVVEGCDLEYYCSEKECEIWIPVRKKAYKMQYEERQQDLFEVGEDYFLAHCISADFGMGKGIVVKFNKRFDMKNQLKKKYPDYLHYYQRHRIGGDCLLEGRVLNLITKERYYQKPTIVTMRLALQRMEEVCKENHITKVAMPTIGAGLDRLPWSEVSDQIQQVFQETSMEILVCKWGS